MPHLLPNLAYPYSSLEPYIDRRTMEIHHDRHHATYVNQLNAALDHVPDMKALSIEDLLRRLNNLPQELRTAVRNNGGGHANHSIFWQVIGPPTAPEPKGVIADAIKASFGGFEAFKSRFTAAALSIFGGGWVWVVDRGDKLAIESTANQDSPLMEGRMPICGLDLWEHAYYLQYQNRRADYVDAWWHVVNWTAVGRRLSRDAASIGVRA